jgi:lipopolysaccharide transport system permease protein
VTLPDTGWTHRRDLFVMLVRRQFWLRRKRSLLAQVWPVLAPFLQMLLYVFVFKRVFRVPIERYPEFLLAGLLPWTFLTVALARSTNSVSSGSSILRKAPMPAELLPLSSVATFALDFLATLGIFVAYLALAGDLRWVTLPGIVFPLVAVVALVMALALLVSLVDVYTHDLRPILGSVLTVWFFLIPIVYRPNMAPPSIEFLRAVDPMHRVVLQMRQTLYFGQWGDPLAIGLMLATSMGALAVALVVFRRHAPHLAKEI